MKKILLASLIGLAAVGCQNSNSSKTSSSSLPPMNSAVTDVSSTPAYTAPAPQPVQQPVIYDTPAVSSTPVSSGSTAMASSSKTKSGSQYKVQKGDTLFAIAKKTYGDGKQWKKIQAANPGLTASNLKVGQTINIP